MNKPLIVLFVGIPGSGKTTFARQIAQRLNAVILSSDGARISMWKTREAIEASHKTPEERLYTNQLTFGALNYATRQIVKAGYNVLFDANANSRSERQEKYDIAKEFDGNAVVVRMRVPYEVSLRRVQEREPLDDQRQFDAEKAVGILERFMKDIEEPSSDENTIYIDGEAPFEEQYQQFIQSYENYFS